MCFETTKNAKAKIAETDIECWKVLNENLSPRFGGRSDRFSHRRTKPYTINVRQRRQKLQVLDNTNGKVTFGGAYIITKGYHSYRNERTAMEECDASTCVRKFIIPVGSQYFENYEEYVSETIMLVE